MTYLEREQRRQNEEGPGTHDYLLITTVQSLLT